MRLRRHSDIHRIRHVRDAMRCAILRHQLRHRQLRQLSLKLLAMTPDNPRYRSVNADWRRARSGEQAARRALMAHSPVDFREVRQRAGYLRSLIQDDHNWIEEPDWILMLWSMP